MHGNLVTLVQTKSFLWTMRLDNLLPAYVKCFLNL